jgi:hypothetical protein
VTVSTNAVAILVHAAQERLQQVHRGAHGAAQGADLAEEAPSQIDPGRVARRPSFWARSIIVQSWPLAPLGAALWTT